MDCKVKNSGLFKEIQKVPELLECQFDTLEHEVRQILSTEDLWNITDVFVTGCGDSYMAALSCVEAFSELGNVRIHAIPALELSAYVRILAPQKRTLIIGLSHSGETSRVVEALGRMKKAGCQTMAITGNRESRLGRLTDKCCVYSAPKWTKEPIPGVAGFSLALACLYLMAIRFGEVKGCITMDQAGKYRQEIRECSVAIRKILNDSKTYEEFSLICAHAEKIEFVGAGSSMGAAKFGAAKVVEAYGRLASAVELEEFAHVEYFEAEPENIPVIIFGGKQLKVAQRFEEIVRVLEKIKRPLLVIEFPGTDEKWLPLFYAVASARLTAAMGIICEEPYFRGFRSVWTPTVGDGVKDSQVIF